jgi:hypothetical protein
MANQALDLKNIQAIIDLKTAINKFSEGIQNALKAANTEINHTFEWLQERISYWQHEIERAQQELSRAQVDLRRCENSGYYDDDGYYHRPNCGCEERAVEQARAYLQQCNEALQIVRMWHNRIEQGASDHMSAANQLNKIADWHSEKAQMNLNQTADKYEAVQSSAGQVGGIGDLLIGAAVTIAASLAAQDPNKQDWIDRNIQMVKINEIPNPDEIKSEDDFIKVSLEDMKAGIHRWQEMRSTIDSGTGNTSEYWSGIDQTRGFDYSGGYQKIYDSFYGQDAIRVEKIGNNYSIINGRHRIWAAKQMGIDQLPIHLIEKA